MAPSAGDAMASHGIPMREPDRETLVTLRLTIHGPVGPEHTVRTAQGARTAGEARRECHGERRLERRGDEANTLQLEARLVDVRRAEDLGELHFRLLVGRLARNRLAARRRLAARPGDRPGDRRRAVRVLDRDLEALRGVDDVLTAVPGSGAGAAGCRIAGVVAARVRVTQKLELALPARATVVRRRSGLLRLQSQLEEVHCGDRGGLAGIANPV